MQTSLDAVQAPMTGNEADWEASGPWACDGSRPLPYRACIRCVMDTTDPEITFDAAGVCFHCHTFDRLARVSMVGGETGRRALDAIVAEIKEAGKNRPYDCIIGVSGGIDSTYVAYVVKELGLRPLAVHLDNGWDSELAVKNIENVLNKLQIDLYTHVLDWDEFKALQVAFLRASTPDGEIPTDHAIGAVLFKVAVSRGIRHIISGGNMATEGILPNLWAYGASDWRYITAVNRRFGTGSLRTYPHFDLRQLLTYNLVRGIRSARILNHVDYDKHRAMATLQEQLGWRYYGGKHYESIYTRFFQGYILPRKFAIDKRRAHFSALICAGQLTRDAALDQLRGEPYPPELQQADRTFVMKKLDLSGQQFDAIMSTRPRSHRTLPTYEPLMERLRGMRARLERSGLIPSKLGI
jgi:N-acetyl sugar amidotransferase